jgi:hypothetical protein
MEPSPGATVDDPRLGRKGSFGIGMNGRGRETERRGFILTIEREWCVAGGELAGSGAGGFAGGP